MIVSTTPTLQDKRIVATIFRIWAMPRRIPVGIPG